MSLDNIKDMTATARDNLVNAIRTKGVSIAEDSTLNQCANAVLMITGGSGSCKYYKCASVDTENKTWTGYLAVLGEDDTYSFEETVTEGLSYTSVTPVVGKTYSADALVLVGSLYSGLPTADLSYYLPLNSATLSTTTGQTVVSYSGTVQSTTYKGIDCVQFDGSTVLKSSVENVSMAESPLTVSFWVASSADSVFIMAWGDPATDDSSYGKRTAILRSNDGIGISGHGAGYGWDAVEDAPFNWDGNWGHICITFGEASNGKRPVVCYVNGVAVRSGDWLYNDFYDSPEMYIGSYWQSDNMMTGYMAALRFYNRVLSQDEITTLANEFAPIA